jgi:hypothetical protein
MQAKDTGEDSALEDLAELTQCMEVKRNQA